MAHRISAHSSMAVDWYSSTRSTVHFVANVVQCFLVPTFGADQGGYYYNLNYLKENLTYCLRTNDHLSQVMCGKSYFYAASSAASTAISSRSMFAQLSRPMLARTRSVSIDLDTASVVNSTRDMKTPPARMMTDDEQSCQRTLPNVWPEVQDGLSG